MTGFRDALDACDTKDMGYSGYKFSWSNKRGDNFIEERLDSAFANEEWLDLFPSFSVHHVWDSSDHLPILVNACKEMGGTDVGVPWDAKLFKIEAKWLHVAEFTSMVRDAWIEAGRSSIDSWSMKVFVVIVFLMNRANIPSKISTKGFVK